MNEMTGDGKENCIALSLQSVVGVKMTEYSKTKYGRIAGQEKMYKIQFTTAKEMGNDDGGGDEEEIHRLFETTFLESSGSVLDLKQLSEYGNRPVCGAKKEIRQFCVCKKSARKTFSNSGKDKKKKERETEEED